MRNLNEYVQNLRLKKKIGAIKFDTSLSSEELAALAKHNDWCVRYAVAGHPNTPVTDLVTLAHDKRWIVRYEVAGNPSIRAAGLAMLARGGFHVIRDGLYLIKQSSVAS